MGITAIQLERRKGHLGSSDVGTLFGLNKFQTQYDLWLQKTGQLEGEKERPWLDLGNEFEDVILKRAARSLGTLRKNQYRSAKDEGVPIACHVDAIVVDSGRPVEAKCAGIFWPIAEVWGEPGTDQVPDRVMIQCQVHLLCTGADACHVVMFGWGMKYSEYLVPRDEAMIEMICAKAQEWWKIHVIGNVAPTGNVSLDVVQRVQRHEDCVVIPDAPIATWRAAAKAKSIAKKAEQAALAEVLKLMGKANEAACSLGTVTYKLEHRDGYVVEAQTYPVPRFKKAKSITQNQPNPA
jgi:putative phage-type endonuclease